MFASQLGPDGATLADGSSPSLCGRLQRTLLDIQYGRVEHPWGTVVE